MKFEGIEHPVSIYVDDKKNYYVSGEEGGFAVFNKDKLPVSRIKKGGEKELGRIYGINVRRDKIYITDTYNHRICVYNIISNGVKYKDSFGKESEGMKSKYKIMMRDSENNKFMVNTEKNMILKYDKNNKLLYRFGKYGVDNASFNMPINLYIDEKDYIKVNDLGNYRIQVFKEKDGKLKYVKTIKKSGPKAKEYYFPMDIEADNNGRLYIADYGDNRIEIIINTNIISYNRGIYRAKGIGSDETGNIWIANTGKNEVLKLNGTVLELKLNNNKKGKKFIKEPYDVAIGYDGEVWVCDRVYAKVIKYNKKYEVEKEIKKTEKYKLITPTRICYNKDGYLYISDSNGGKIVVFDEGVYLVDLKTSSLFFSPNNDGILDDVALSFVSYEPMEGVLSVYNSKGKEVQTLWKYENNTAKTQTGYISEIREGKFKIKNSKVITNKFIWSGKDKKGMVLPEDEYTIKIDVKDNNDNENHKELKININNPPEFKLISGVTNYISPNKDGINDNAEFLFTVNEAGIVNIRIAGNTVSTQEKYNGEISEINKWQLEFKNNENITNKFIWNGKDKKGNALPEDKYIIKVDLLHN